MLKLKLQYFAENCKEPIHWKRPWSWERLWAGGEGDDRGWDGWMASPTQWTWVWENSRSWWWIGRPVMLQSTGSQRVRHDWVTELDWTDSLRKSCSFILSFKFYTCSCQGFIAPLIEETVFVSFVKDKMPRGVWVCLWAFYLLPLVYLSFFFIYLFARTVLYTVLVTGSFVVQPEVRKIASSSSDFLSQDCFGYLGTFVFP